MKDFDCVSFDIDQTLIDFDTMLKAALQAASNWLFEHTSRRVSIEEFQYQRDVLAKTYTGKAVNMLAIRHASFCQILAANGLSKDMADPLLEVFKAVRFGQTKFMPGALEMLENLPSGLKVAALTNGNSDPNKLGFGQYFDVTVLAENYPFEKPDPRTFEILMEKLELVAPKRCIHIGDSLDNDVKGANQSGLILVWYNPEAKIAPASLKPEFEIAKLSELLTILK